MSYMPYGATQSYQSTQYFPQPQGNVYFVNNSLEVANIPMGASLSVVLCPSESTMYIKTMQGGAPTMMVYSIKPFEQSPTTVKPQESEGNSDLREQVEQLTKSIEELKKQIGGQKLNDLL